MRPNIVSELRILSLNEEMALPHSLTWPLSSFISSKLTKDNKFNMPTSFCGTYCLPKHKPWKKLLNLNLPSNLSFLDGDARAIRVPSRIQALKSGGAGRKRRREASSDTDDDDDDDDDVTPPFDKNDPFLMSPEERLEWRTKIRQVLDMKPEIQEELDPVVKKEKLQKLLKDYPLVVEEEDPDWPEDADGWGFSMSQFFDKITIKNKKKDNDDDDDNDVDREEIVWQDDNYIRPIKDIKSSEWEETVFKDISPLIILVHNRYKRPKENERIRDELEQAVHIIWNCRLPSPRCVAIDAVVETELVAALQVSVFPEIIFTKAGKILFRDKAIRSAEEWSKIMAFFYYGAAKPSCLNSIAYSQENIPSFVTNSEVS
ncbi:hypothetical protein RJT34_25728 [Clitoria ternatea]|uniref:Thioredoxin-like fold domain-containing protein MRL7L, chloroplastic n=1 Tax=Clitoria ternatea TaxID=43366 RepID=A0AAN9FQB8_CLITE